MEWVICKGHCTLTSHDNAGGLPDERIIPRYLKHLLLVSIQTVVLVFLVTSESGVSRVVYDFRTSKPPGTRIGDMMEGRQNEDGRELALTRSWVLLRLETLLERHIIDGPL